MTRGQKPVGEDDLVAYVDDELTAERRALVEVWLEEHPDIAARIARDGQISARLRSALGAFGEGPLPAHLRVDAIRRDLRRQRMGAARLAAAAALLLAVGLGAGWTLNDYARGAAAPADEITAALVAHRVFVAEKAHPVEVSAESRDHLGVWLGNRLGTRVEIPDLSDAGLTLMGGRLLPGPDGPAGQLMYETPDGQRVTLYMQPGAGEASSFFFAEFDRADALAWRSPDLSYVLTGPFDRDRLTAIAHQIHGASGI